ncbi:hypothetical protein Mal65_11290 [Crateriforma conspicua]|nr:hypothetical protein Mal65_11290 [Crateriforma conspicua]
MIRFLVAFASLVVPQVSGSRENRQRCGVHAVASVMQYYEVAFEYDDLESRIFLRDDSIYSSFADLRRVLRASGICAICVRDPPQDILDQYDPFIIHIAGEERPHPHFAMCVSSAYSGYLVEMSPGKMQHMGLAQLRSVSSGNVIITTDSGSGLSMLCRLALQSWGFVFCFCCSLLLAAISIVRRVLR